MADGGNPSVSSHSVGLGSRDPDHCSVVQRVGQPCPVERNQRHGVPELLDHLPIFEGDLFAALFNNLMLVVWLTVCSAIGMLFAYLLDKNIRGSSIYQSIYYFPVVLSLAVVGFIWKSTMFSRDRGLLNAVWPGGPVDFVGDGTKLFSFDLPISGSGAGAVEEFRGAAHCHGVATHRLHHGHVLGRSEGGRCQPA